MAIALEALIRQCEPADLNAADLRMLADKAATAKEYPAYWANRTEKAKAQLIKAALAGVPERMKSEALQLVAELTRRQHQISACVAAYGEKLIQERHSDQHHRC